MLSRVMFIEAMERLETLDRNIGKVDEALRQLSNESTGLFLPEATDIALDVISATLGDKEGWLQYFAYDRDWLKNCKFGDVEFQDEPMDTSTWGKVYDFMIRVGLDCR